VICLHVVAEVVTAAAAITNILKDSVSEINEIAASADRSVQLITVQAIHSSSQQKLVGA